MSRANPTDGTRMVAALAARQTRGPVNRKRVQRLMRKHRLLQPKRSEGRRRPGYSQVTRPDELWHPDMTSVWVAEHGRCYLNAAIDCCTREIVARALDIRCRAADATAVVDAAITGPGPTARTLTLGTDNGTFPRPAFRARLAEQQITHRRGGYRHPERQAFIESWFAKLKQRCVWREEFETLDEARAAIGAYIDRYHHRPGLPNPARGRGHLEGSPRPIKHRRPATPTGSTPSRRGRLARRGGERAAYMTAAIGNSP
jgi:putative transposase